MRCGRANPVTTKGFSGFPQINLAYLYYDINTFFSSVFGERKRMEAPYEILLRKSSASVRYLHHLPGHRR
jgi:hypothetical protein